MAEEDDTTNCQVCFETFAGTGDHIPRILPCFHTVCETCVKQLIRLRSLECPECRTKHKAKNEYLSFPQNKYVLSNLKIKVTSQKCQEHNKVMVLYCNETSCKKAICTICMLKEHKNHDMRDFEDMCDEKRESLLASLSSLNIDIKTKKEGLVGRKEFLSEKSKTCVEMMKEKKKEVMKAFDDMIKEAEKVAETMKKEIHEAVETASEQLRNVQQMETLVPVGKFDKLIEVGEKITEIRETVTEDALKYKFLDFVPAKPDVKSSCGIYSCLELTAADVTSRVYNSRAEATFEYTVQNVSTMEVQESPDFMVRDMPWYIDASRITEEGATLSDTLGFSLFCRGPLNSTSWSCKVKSKLTLLNQNPNTEPLSTGGDVIYRAGKESCWGCDDFISWEDLLDEEKGYYNVKDDSITLQVHLVAEKPILENE